MKNYKIIILILLSTYSYCLTKNITWTNVLYNTSIQFKAIDNCDSNYAMAVADILDSWDSWGAVLKTTDAGLTWNYALYDTDRTKAPYFAYPQDISHPTRDFCIIGLDSNAFLKTTDGGITWNEYIVDLPYYLFGFDDVDMYDENHGVMKQQRYLVVSHDGFRTWDTIPAPGGYYIFCVEMPAPNSICVLSRDLAGGPDFDERFYRSDDGGKTWDEYPHPDYRIPQELQFVDSLIGYEVGGKSTGVGQQKSELIFRTIDGGRTWEKVLDTVIGCSFGLQKLDFYDKDNGIAVGQCGAVFWTHDGGKSWFHNWDSAVMAHTPPTMNVCYIRKDRAIICDFLGRIFISEDTTTDVIEEFPNDDDFAVYPNPATDKIKIRLKDEFINSKELQIFNSYGQEIMNKLSSDFQLTTKDFHLLELDISTLTSGVYFVVINENGKVSTKAFVVIR